MSHTLSVRIVAELAQALKQFGTYSFDDKGASEVMGIEELTEELRKLPVAEAAVVLHELACNKKYKGRCMRVAEDLLMNLQDWDELFAIPGIDDIFNGDEPGKPSPAPVAREIAIVSGADLMSKLLGAK